MAITPTSLSTINAGRLVVRAELRNFDEHLDLFGPDLTVIPVSTTGECDHTITICDTFDCVESWCMDWLLHFNQSGIAFRHAYLADDGILDHLD